MSIESSNALELARASYRDIALYAPDRAPCAIDLSDNTNCWGIPPAAERALRDAAPSTVTRYPNLYAAALKEALGAYLGVERGMLVTGCGSDDVLDSAIRAFAEPGDAIAYPDPSFAMIPIFARMNGLVPMPVPLTESLDADADAMLATGARIIYLCSPNNPTGGSLTRATIDRVVRDAPGVVIIDEAYAEFATADCRDERWGASRVADAQPGETERLRHRSREQHPVRRTQEVPAVRRRELGVCLVDDHDTRSIACDAVDRRTRQTSPCRIVRRAEIDDPRPGREHRVGVGVQRFSERYRRWHQTVHAREDRNHRE